MENATDALIMAASVLLLIIALSVSISSFSKLRNQADEILYEGDLYRMAKVGDEYLNYFSSSDENAVRAVGAETVIPTIMRLLKEQMDFYIYDEELINKLNDVTNKENPIKDLITTIQAGKDTINTSAKKSDGTTVIIKPDNKIIKFELTGSKWQKINDKSLGKLYDYLIDGDKKYYEYIGIYKENTGASSANKETRRVVTFVRNIE